jgi:hypothetical protein
VKEDDESETTIPTAPGARGPAEKGVMPSLLDLDLLPSPLVDPLSYPGATLRHGFLWLDTWVYRVEPVLGVGRPELRVEIDGGPLAARGAAGPLDEALLDEALQAAGATAMAGRRPVLAFGSNASPAQLSTKFAALDRERRVLPVLRGSVAGFALAHSAHISSPGYVPYVIVDAGTGAALDAFVLWLDPDQRAALDRTEPNYRLVRVPAERYPLTVESMPPIEEYSAYRGRWGALRWPGERLPAPAGTQRQVFDGLGRQPWFQAAVGPGDARSWITGLAANAALRDRIRAELAAAGMAIGDGWQARLSPAG